MLVFRLIIAFLFLSLCCYGQQDSVSAKLNEAKKVVDQKRIEFSEDHIEYHQAVLDYARIMYYELNEWVDAEDYARPALEFIYKEYGKTSSTYITSAKKIPDFAAITFTLEFDLEKIEKEKGRKNEVFLSKIIEYLPLTIQEKYSYFYGIGDTEDVLKELLKTLQELEYPKEGQLYKDLYQNMPLALIEVYNAELKMRTEKSKASDSKAYLRSLIDYINTAYLHGDKEYTPFDEDDAYQFSQEANNLALKLNDKKLIVQTRKLFSDKAWNFYTTEKQYLDYLQEYTAPNDTLVRYLRQYLNVIDSPAIGYTYTHEVCNDLIKRIPKENHYYAIVQAICENWDLSELEIKIAAQKIVVANTRNIYGAESEEYVAALLLLNQHLIDNNNDDEEVIFNNYIKAFETLEKIDAINNLPDFDDLNFDDLDFDFDDETPEEEEEIKEEIPDTTKPKEAPQEVSNKFGKYLQTIPFPWRDFIINEYNLKTIGTIEDRTGKIPAAMYFKAGWDYFKANVVIDRGEKYYKKGIKILAKEYKFECIQWLEKYFRLNPRLNTPDEYKYEIIQNLSLPQVQSLLKEPLQYALDAHGKVSYQYVDIYEMIGHAFFLDRSQDTNADTALAIYKDCLGIIRGTIGESSSDYEELLDDVTNFIVSKGSPWSIETDLYFFDLLVNHHKDNNYGLGRILPRYANWHYNHDRWVAAEPLYSRFIRIVEEETKDLTQSKQKQLANALYKNARIYRKTGRYLKAFKLYNTVLQVANTTGEYLLLIRSANDMGLLFQYIKDYDEAIRYFDLSLNLLYNLDQYPFGRHKSKAGALTYIKTKRNLGKTYFLQGNYAKAQEHYQTIKDFEATSPYVSFNRDYSLQRDFALLYDKLEKDDKAERFYKLAIKRLEDVNDRADILIDFAKFYTSRKQAEKAGQYYLEAIKLDIQQIRLSYPNLSEEERLQFLRPIKNRLNSFSLFVVNYPNDTLITEALNAHLIIKGLALENTNNINDAILNSENVKLKKLHKKLLSLRKELANVAVLSAAKRKEKNIDIEAIQDRVKNLERQLSVESKYLRQTFDKQNKQVDFVQIRDSLPSNTAAIDFMAVDGIDSYGDEVTRYYALIIQKDSIAPTLVPLTTEEEVTDILDNEVTPNSINYITDDLESRYLYELVWMPMEAHLKNVKQIYLSPSGVLSKIAFATLQTSDYTPEKIMDKWAIRYYSSLRDLLKQPKPTLNKKITLIGGVKFNLTDQELTNIAIANKLDEQATEELLNDAIAYTDVSQGNTRGEDFNYLPGTLQEVNKIAVLFQQKDWNTELITGTNALEENIQKIDTVAPDILHIATHGFFFTQEEEELDELSMQRKKKKVSTENRLATTNDPLLRSGLALTGINVIWQDGKNIDGLEDGILFAKEVAGMNLFDTELVVLSACETGRGDIDNDEGIMGLQRAFKTAGAHKLIISLWKVPDQQTSELMQLFYKYYLSSNDVHNSFRKAQQIMKQRYRNPYYWAAFLLIE